MPSFAATSTAQTSAASPAWAYSEIAPVYENRFNTRRSRAHWRTDEYRLFGSGAPRQWMAAAGIALTGYRAIRDKHRARTATDTRP